jgi:hypothetical protein
MMNDTKNIEMDKLRFQGILGQLISLSQSQVDLGTFIQNFITGMVELMEAEGGSIWVKREDRLDLAFFTGDSKDAVPFDEEIPTEETMLAKVISERHTYAVGLKNPKTGSDETLIGIYKPIVIGDEFFGVLKLVKKRASGVIYQEEIGLLEAVGGLIPVYLKQMRLPRVISRMEDIGKLFEFNKVIFSDLDLRKIAYSIANLLPSTVSCERCIVAFNKKGKADIEAVTGQDMIEKKSVTLKNLNDIMQHALTKGDAFSLSDNMTGEDVLDDLKAEKDEYFRNNPFKFLYAVPIKDDKKILGIIAIETSKDSFTQNDLTILNFAAGQAAIAFKNARLYHEIPYAGIWRKLSGAKDRVNAIPGAKRALIISVVILVLLLPFVIKIPNKIKGGCEVFPVVKHYARVKTDGILKDYLVKEGESVSAGRVVALMDDTEILKKLREAQSRQGVLKATMTKDFGAGKMADYEISRLRYMEVDAEIDLLKYNLSNTNVLAEGPGIVLTPESRLTERIGKPVSKGEEILEVGGLGDLLVEVAVPEKDIRFIKPGQEIDFILDAIQEGSFKTKVSNIREKAEARPEGNFFIVEGKIQQQGYKFKPGMKGKAKVYADKKPIWYVYLRDMIEFFRTKVFF